MINTYTSYKQTTTILADEQNMDLRNILDILTESEGEVKPIIPEVAGSNKISDLRIANSKFNQKGAESTLQPMIDSWEVESLTDFIKNGGFTPTYVDVDKKGEEQVNEYFANLPPIIDDCPECLGDGYVLGDEYTDPIRVCDECLGWTYLEDDRPPEQRINRDAQDKVLKLNINRKDLYINQDEEVYSESEFLGGKDGKEPAVKYKDSTEADLADRMLRSKGPKGPDRQLADKDEGSTARELRLIKQLSGQTKIDEEEIDEVLDAQSRKLGGRELTGYLDRILAKQKGKTDKYKLPYVHRSLVKDLIPIVDQEKNPYDLDKLAKDITVRPARLLKQNEKMQHSDGTTSIFYNIGLPALTGLGYDETKKEFVIINTCPGAGECKTFCYALKGGYVQWRASSLSQTRILNYLWNDPNGFMEQLSTEIDRESRKADAKQGKHKVTIRWHDAGDFFSDEYLDLAYKLAATHPTVDFYAYTKIADVAGSVQNRPPNFKINFSMGARKGEEKRVDFGVTKHSSVVPKEVFNDLIQKDGNKLIKDAEGRIQWNDPEDWETFKERLANKYSIDPKTILSYSEMMKTPLGSRSKGDNADGARGFKNDLWNVVVAPGDGDDSANRSDVLGTYLLMH